MVKTMNSTRLILDVPLTEEVSPRIFKLTINYNGVDDPVTLTGIYVYQSKNIEQLKTIQKISFSVHICGMCAHRMHACLYLSCLQTAVEASRLGL